MKAKSPYERIKDLKAKWHKDLIQDEQRERNMDEKRLNKKEGK